MNNYVQRMRIILNDINVNGKEIWEIEHCDVPKKIELSFDTKTKKDTFFT